MSKITKVKIEQIDQKDILPTDYNTNEAFDAFLNSLASSSDLPDEMEIFTTDRGWHKIKDYR